MLLATAVMAVVLVPMVVALLSRMGTTDLTYHVRLTALPRPGREDQLHALMARLQALPLDRRRPLWELWAVEGLKECQEHAAKVGIRMAIEPLNRFETYFINRHDQALELAEQVGGNCGVCLDFYQMCAEENSWESALRASAGRLANVHIADSNRMPPGRGSIDWKRALQVLSDTGYTGYLSVEFLAPLDRVPRHGASKQGVTDVDSGFPTDDGSGVVQEQDYDRYVKETIDYMRQL